ncbi:MAG: hypothetical protein U0P45_12325 [Acidimicrobiales bacterium]
MARHRPTLDATVVQQPTDLARARLLVLVHGYGEPVATLTDRLALIDPERRHLVVAPEGPFEHKGQTIWHRALHAGDEADQQFRASLAAIDDLLGRVEDEHGLPASEAIVGGFSQGGGLGIAMLLGADVAHRPRGAFGVCSFAPHISGFRVDRAAATGRPCLLTSAHQDHFAPIEVSRAGAVALQQAGLDLTFAETDGGHVMTDEAAATVGRWLAWLDGGEPVERGHDLLADVGPRADYLEELWELVS